MRLETAARVSAGPDGPVATQRDGTLVAYGWDGTLRWRRSLGGSVAGAPVVAPDGAVVVGSRDGTVLAYESDGTRRWRDDTPDGLFAPHVNDATPFRIAPDGETVVLAHPRGTVVAYALADGTKRWAVESQGRTHRPAIGDGRVFLTSRRAAGGDGGLVRALSLDDGSEQWSNQSDGSLGIGAGFHRGVVYTADISGRLVAREGSDGSERWRVRIDGDPWLSTIPTAFADRVWVGTLSDGLYGLTEAGVQAHADVDTPTTPAVGDDRLYVGSSEFGSAGGDAGSVLALDADGGETWREQTRGYPESQVEYLDGRVAFGTDTGVLDAVDADGGARRWRRFERPATLPAPVVGPRTVYCGSRTDGVGGYRVTDGTGHLWHVGFDGTAPGTPAVAGQTVLAGSRAGDVAGTPLLEYADDPPERLTPTPTVEKTTTHIDAPSPEPRWRRELAGPIGDVGYGTDTAYLGSGTAVASLTAGGDVRWETDVGGRVRGAPAVGDGVVYAARTDETVLALTTGDGTERWRATVGDAATAPSLTVAGGEPTLVVGTDAGVVALTATDGTERWRTETGRVRGTPAATEDLAVVGDDGGVVRGLALADGTERWRTETGGAIHGAPAIAGGVAYVGSRDRHLYAVSTRDGAVNWRFELDDWVDSSPAVAYGAVFVVDQSGALSAIVGGQ